jgi:hypothetical protein
MDVNGYRKKLLSNSSEEIVESYVNALKVYSKYLQKEGTTIDKVKPKKIVAYTELLLGEKERDVLTFLRALINYAYFTKRIELIEAAIDISESYNAMDTLFTRVAEWHGEELRDELFIELKIPPLGLHPEKKPSFTKEIMKRIELKLGRDKAIELLKPCLHQGMGGNIEEDRKKYQEIGIDAFLKYKKEEQVKTFEKYRDEGLPAFAQPVDYEVVEYVRNLIGSALGIRRGKVIYITKVPYKVKKLLHTNDDRLKRFYACYCPWVRGAIKEGTDENIPEYFCQCSAGWFKDYFEALFEESVTIEPVETALTGVPYCKFAIHLPENVIIKE